MKLTEIPSREGAKSKRKFLPLTLSLIVKEPELRSNCLHLPHGYYTLPERQRIVAMNFQVNNFAVSNGRTSIEWRGPMDLSAAVPTTLAQLLDFGEDFVQVYRDASQTPPIGRGFNRQCVATFSNGKDYLSRSKTYPQLLKKLGRLCRSNGTELVCFDMKTLSWKVRIFHFTKVLFTAISMGDDEEVDEPDNMGEEAYYQPAHPPLQPSALINEVSAISKPLGRRDSMQTEEMLTPYCRQEVKYSTKLQIPQGKHEQVNGRNSAVQKHSYRPKLWTQIRFGGSGFKFQLQRSVKGYIIEARHKSERLVHRNQILLDPELQPTVTSIPRIIQSCEQERVRYTLSLINILFGDQITYTMKNDRLWHTPGAGLDFMDAIRAWFESRVKHTCIRTQNQHLALLARRNLAELSRVFEKKGQSQIAVALSHLEQECFRSAFLPSTDFPTELQQVLGEDMSCVEDESWVVQLGMLMWYCFEADIPSKILELVEAVSSKKEVESQHQLRLLKLYSQIKKISSGVKTDKLSLYPEKLLGDEVLAWLVSNTVYPEELKVLKKSEVKSQQYRQVHNLLARLCYADRLKLILKDRQVSQRIELTALLMKKAIRREGLTRQVNTDGQELAKGKHAGLLPQLRTKVKVQWLLYQGKIYEAVSLILQQKPLKKAMEWADRLLRREFPLSMRTLEQVRVFEAIGSSELPPRVRLLRFYLGFQTSRLMLTDEELLDFLEAYKSTKIGQRVIRKLAEALLLQLNMQRPHMCAAFRQQRPLYEKVLEFFNKAAEKVWTDTLKLMAM